MNCKDCYCFDVCSRATVRSDNTDTHKENECKYFRDKDRIIELPCKVCDLVYFISKRYTKCSIHKDFAGNCGDGCYEVCERGAVCDSKLMYEIRSFKYAEQFEILRDFAKGKFGKELFLTETEARKRLEENWIG